MDFYACKGSETELKGAPSIVKLLPLGTVKSERGNFIVDEESFAEMKAEFDRRQLDKVIDYEHQTLQDVQAPAGGWIKELLLQENAIAARVEWTPKAREYLEKREYKYLSPVVIVGKADRRARLLHSAALTNTPAIDGMFPIINSIDLSLYEGDDPKEEGGNSMNAILKKLAELLGLDESATEEQIVQAITATVGEAKQLKDAARQREDSSGDQDDKIVANSVVCTLLGLKAGAPTEEVTAAIMSLKSATSGVTEAEFLALKQKVAEREANDAVDSALHAGKLMAAQKEWAIEYALKDPKGFAGFVEKAPQVVVMKEIAPNSTNLEKGKGHDEATLLACKQLGISPEDLEKYGKDVG